jgi:hypothetical protein
MQLFQKRIHPFIWLILFVFTFAISSVSAAEKAGGAATEIQKPSHYLVATYFHNTFRCPTCHMIEEQSAAAIQKNFANELKNGTLVWRVINVDEPENKHYIQEYRMYTKHLIISEVKDGKEVRWKDLPDVWTFVRNQEKFEQYVTAEIKDWLKGLS